MMLKNRNKNFHVSHLEHLRSLNGLPLATFRSRTIAFIIDFAVILVLVILVGLPAAWSDYKSGVTANLNVPFEPFNSFSGLIVMIAYFSTLTFLWEGQTIGKRLMKIRVISVKSDKITLWQSVERSVGYGASALEAGFGFYQAAFYENHQAVHDRIAETVVIKRQKIKKESVVEIIEEDA